MDCGIPQDHSDEERMLGQARIPATAESDSNLTRGSESSNVRHSTFLDPALPDCLGHPKTPSFTEEPSALASIEQIFESIAANLLSATDEPVICLKKRPVSIKGLEHSADSTQELSFPGKSADEAHRFTVVMRILEMLHEALRTGVVLSKRDIYYRDPALFVSQGIVNRYIDDLALTFGLSRSKLNVTAAAKGLILGAVGFCRRCGTFTDARDEMNGILVPALRDLLSVDMTAAQWILVIEKEATFRSIVSSDFGEELTAKGVIMTGKGYPDIATRALLHLMSTATPRNGFCSPPVYALVDWDPDGLAIMSTYRNGSIAISSDSVELCVPQMQWLGLGHDHLFSCGDDAHATQGLLELTQRDRRKATVMLERSQFNNEDAEDCAYTRALQTMLMLNLKAELQLLESQPSGMETLLRSKLDMR